MSIIIRLQNLPWDASALNIRQFFFGLSIPDGGVHIIGGEKGDAFIAFSTDEDARQAMKNDGGYIGSTQLKLFLSSKTEMQNVIAAARESSAPAPSGGTASSAGPSTDLSQSQRMRFINPAHSSNQQISKFNQPSYGSAVTRMNFMQQNQQQPMQQQFGRPISNDFRPPNTEFHSLISNTNEFRPLAPNLTQSRFSSFEHRSAMAETRAPRINFDPKQAYHEQKSEPYWGANQTERQKEHVNNQLYEPFGAGSDKQGFPYKKQEHIEGQSLSSDALGRGEDWNGRGNSLGEFSMDMRQNNDFSMTGSEFGMRGDFDRGVRNSFERRDSENDFRRPRLPETRFGPMVDEGMNITQMGSGGNYVDDDRWREGVPKFGVDRFSPKREFHSEMFMGKGRFDFHDFKGFCVYVRDLPSYFGPRDIRVLFRNCDISTSRVNMVHDRSGKKFGQAYVRLSCPEELDAALRENGRTVEDHRIRVTRCHEKDFDEAGLMDTRQRSRHRSRSPRISSEQEGCYAVIKNLPGLSFIKKCLDDVKIARNGGPFMEIGKNGKENGIALVELEHRKHLELLLKNHKVSFGGHPAHVYKIPRTEFRSRVRASRVMSPEGESNSSNYTCLEIDGLSWGCDDEKVRKFFSGLHVAPNSLHIFLDKSGKASGLGYIEFQTSADCNKAMEKHKQYLDNRYLVLRMISQKEMDNLLERHIRVGGRILNDTYKGKGQAPLEGGNYEETVIYMKNLNTRTRLEDILDFFHGYKVVKDSIQLQYKDDRPTGDGMVKFGSKREAEDAIMQLNRKVMLGKVVELLF